MNKKIVKLFSLLLLAVFLLTGCSNLSVPVETDSTETSSVNDEPLYIPEDAGIEAFFVISEEKAWDTLEKATRFDGTLVSRSEDGKLIVLRTADVDLKNNVTETFTVYNTELKRSVYTTTNTYQNGSYSAFDWENTAVTDETVKYPESVVDVSVETLSSYYGYGELQLIKVSRAKIVEIEEDFREENPESCFYEIELSYEFYDVAGKEIAKTRNDHCYVDYTITSASYVGVSFGSTLALFDIETMQLCSVVNGETGNVIGGYDYETEKYGYFLNEEKFFKFIEVYNKESGARILRYHLERRYADSQVFLLQSGNILIQYIDLIPEESNRTPDYYTENDKVALSQGILDVETGLFQSIELGGYVQELIRYTDLEKHEFRGVEFTKNVQNLVLFTPIKDQKLQKDEIRVLDNNCKEVFKLEALTPEHNVKFGSTFGFEILPSGDYLVDLVDVVRPKAIVSKDGVVRSYLTEDAKVVGVYVVTSEGVFDYDLNCLYTFEDNAYTFEYILGEKIIVSSKVVDENDPDAQAQTTYYELLPNANFFVETEVFHDSNVVMSTESYVIAYHRETQKYTLYNTELEHVLTTQNRMTVYELDGNYLVYTQLEEYDLFYTID